MYVGICPFNPCHASRGHSTILTDSYITNVLLIGNWQSEIGNQQSKINNQQCSAYVCSTPTLNSGTSGFNAAASSASTIASRVPTGSIILSIHKRAAPYRGSVCSS